MLIHKNEYHDVFFDSKNYIRFGPYGWYEEYGMSLERVSYEDKLEEEFQNAIPSD